MLEFVVLDGSVALGPWIGRYDCYWGILDLLRPAKRHWTEPILMPGAHPNFDESIPWTMLEFGLPRLRIRLL